MEWSLLRSGTDDEAKQSVTRVRLVLVSCLSSILAIAAFMLIPRAGERGMDLAFARGLREATIALNVDVSQSDETQSQILFKRGFVNSLQTHAGPRQLANARHQVRLGADVTNLIFDLNKEEHKDLFSWKNGQLSFRSSDLIVNRIKRIRTILLVDQVPDILVQLSGTPFRAAVDKTYRLGKDNVENYYPLPNPTCSSSVQQAIADLIVDATRRLGEANIFWIGTQEPTHTTGFSRSDAPLKNLTDATCADKGDLTDKKVTKALGTACRKINVVRFINYWHDIVLRSRAALPGTKFGGIQLNSHDNDIYVFAARELVRQQCRIDLYTIQRYSSYQVIQQNLYEVYQIFQRRPAFKHVRVAYDRYSFDNDASDKAREYWLTTAGMSSFLRDEEQIMDRAEIMHSWSYQITGLTWSHGGNTSLLPEVFKWLQEAPKVKRIVAFSSAAPGLGAFALAERSSGRASVAIWNLGEKRQDVRVTLLGGGTKFHGSPHVLKGAADAIHAQAAILRRKGRDVLVSHTGGDGFALEPNDFLLISV